MKSKSFNRMKRLFTILTVVMLLNVILLLLTAVLKQKNMPEPGGTDFSGNGDLFASAGEEASTGEDIFENENLAVPDKDGISDKENGAASSPENIPDRENGAASSPEDIPDRENGAASSPEDIPDRENGAASSPEDIADRENGAASSPEDIWDKENAAASSSKDIPEDGDLPSSAENDLSGKKNPENPSVADISGDKNPAGFPDTDDKENNPLPDIIPPKTSDDDTVTLCLMGDLMCLAGQQYTAERRDGSHDYTGSFYLLRDTFAACDFVIGNLETTLSESNPYSTKEREVNEQPNCNAPADYLASLKWAGITHLVTANNHSLDGGLIGVEETIAHLEEYGIPHTGTYRENYSGARYLMLEKNGIRIALLCFTELINQRELVTSRQLSQIIDSYSRADAEKRIAQARADGADFVIVYEHWGSENVHEVRAYQKSHAREIAESGADLIIGSHPHCLQETETIITQDGRSVPCFYSLGNVVSSMTRDINHDTVFVLVQLRRGAGESGVGKPLRQDAAEICGQTTPLYTEQSAWQDVAEIYGQTTPLYKKQSPRQDAVEILGQIAQPPRQDAAEIPENGKVSMTSLSLLACHVLTSFDRHSRVITPVDYPTDDEKAAAELAAAKERIGEIFPSLD